MSKLKDRESENQLLHRELKSHRKARYEMERRLQRLQEKEVTLTERAMMHENRISWIQEEQERLNDKAIVRNDSMLQHAMHMDTWIDRLKRNQTLKYLRSQQRQSRKKLLHFPPTLDSIQRIEMLFAEREDNYLFYLHK